MVTLTRINRNQTGLKIKIDHESTKIRRHESLNVVLFRVFSLSCFRDCVSEFSAIKNVKISNFSISPGKSYFATILWIPAFAGMTIGCERLSFPRRRESSLLRD